MVYQEIVTLKVLSLVQPEIPLHCCHHVAKLVRRHGELYNDDYIGPESRDLEQFPSKKLRGSQDVSGALGTSIAAGSALHRAGYRVSSLSAIVQFSTSSVIQSPTRLEDTN